MSGRQHALVIGGSLAGMFAAKALSQIFKQVTIIERDTLPDEITVRDGVPQSRHVHQLLVGGLNVMRELFPGLDDDLEAAGAIPIHMGYNFIMATRYGFMPPVETGMHSFLSSRPALESVIRQHINNTDNICIIQGYSVIQLLTDKDKRVVSGVLAEKKREKSSEQFNADLVVDASGRNSKAITWLEELGYDAPEATHIDAHVGYASCWFEKPDYAPDGIPAMLSLGDADNPRTCLISEVEGNKWLAMAASKNHDYPPTDLDGFLEFTKGCPSPFVYNYLKHAKAISPVYGYRRTENHWRHYEKMTRRPENFVITGDAACAFNPIYGHGMSVAAMDAKLMGQILKSYAGRNLTGFADEFQQALAKQVEVVFSLASADDLEQPTVEGEFPEQPPALKWLGLYFRQALRAMFVDDVVRVRFNRVSNLIDSPLTLFKPGILLRVFIYTLKEKFAPNNLPRVPQYKVGHVHLEPQMDMVASI